MLATKKDLAENDLILSLPPVKDKTGSSLKKVKVECEADVNNFSYKTLW